ncbi:MAG: hypothetical protein KF716_31195 [Anaerolineae bacterium]|nr:hypothetical protein [Anaerolineae bacterium]
MSTSLANQSTLFQSGQIIPLSHLYEMVGATDYLGKRKIRLFLKTNDRFPEYEGREVCWRMSTLENGDSNDDNQANINPSIAVGRVSTYVG